MMQLNGNGVVNGQAEDERLHETFVAGLRELEEMLIRDRGYTEESAPRAAMDIVKERLAAGEAHQAEVRRIVDEGLIDLTDEATSARFAYLKEGLTPDWGYTEESARSAAMYMLASERVPPSTKFLQS